MSDTTPTPSAASSSQFHGSAAPDESERATCSPYPAILCAILLSRKYLCNAKKLTLSAPHWNKKSFRLLTSPALDSFDFDPGLFWSLSAAVKPLASAPSVFKCRKLPTASRV